MTFGEFYRQKVLTQKSLVERTMPRYKGEMRIGRDLFGWKVYSGETEKYYVNCRSEEEARFVRIFFEIGKYSVKVPRNNEYLKKILVQLEEMKAKADETIDFYSDGILSRKMRNKLKDMVWAELLE